MSKETYAKTERLRTTAADLLERIEAGEAATLVDVRNSKSWKQSEVKIRGAVRIDPTELPLSEAWPKDHLLAFY